MLDLVISGGQRGSDLAGIVAAQRVNIPTGGTAPKFFKTEAGFQPVLRDRFNLKESHSNNYAVRTEQNIIDSNVTIILAVNPCSPGTKLTINLCKKHKKKYFIANPFIDPHENLRGFLLFYRPKIVNVAGNRESIANGITRTGADYLTLCLQSIKNK